MSSNMVGGIIFAIVCAGLLAFCFTYGGCR